MAGEWNEATRRHFERLRSEPGFNRMQSLGVSGFPGVYIGNHIAARDYPALRKAGVKRMVCANGNPPPYFAPSSVKYLVLDLEDDVTQPMSRDMLERAFGFIDEGRAAGEGVLVFCTAGISRSAAVLVAYLMDKGKGYDDALEAVRVARQWVKPNSGFERQLRALWPSPSCELCSLKRTTEWYDESDARFVIIECDQCENPMAVWRCHTMRITESDARDMEKALVRVADDVLGKAAYYVDKKQRTILDHLHWHARPKPPWMRRSPQTSSSHL